MNMRRLNSHVTLVVLAGYLAVSLSRENREQPVFLDCVVSVSTHGHLFWRLQTNLSRQSVCVCVCANSSRKKGE
jgi:hypothetical protein